MHTLHFGPRILITNTKKEDTMFEEIGAPPPVINSFQNETEQSVREWYTKHSKKKLTTQTKQEPLQFIPPAPPCINLSSEEEK